MAGLLVCGESGGICGDGQQSECGLVGQVAVLWICAEGECETVRAGGDSIMDDWVCGAISALAAARGYRVGIGVCVQYFLADWLVGV